MQKVDRERKKQIDMITAEIVTIGDEILIGQIVDTNSAWLGEQLNELGVKVSQITSISDSKEHILSTLKRTIESNTITIVTGGLGPTKDDITKHTLAEMFNCKLVKNEACYRAVEELCRSKNLDFNELNQGQGYVPECCTAIVNDNGTAPAMIFNLNGNYLISLPGVPFEMKPLCRNKIFPFLKEKLSLSHNLHISATVFGIAESMLAKAIEKWEDTLPPYLHLAYLPNPGRVRLRLSAYGIADAEKVRAEIEQQFDNLKNFIPSNSIERQSELVEVNTAELLLKRGETLSTAESCTGGAVAARFTAMAGASKYFLGGVVSYSNEVKSTVLGVNKDNLNKFGAVSEIVVKEMAEGVRRLTGSTYAIATSGVAGPDGGTEDKPVGTVWMAVATPNGTITEKRLFTKLREQNIEYASVRVITLLRNEILK